MHVPGCFTYSLPVLPSGCGSPNLLFLSPGSTVPLAPLRMSETVAVAMAMPHCNILFAARPLTLAAASKPGKSRRGEGGEAATGSSGMLITPLTTVCPSLCRRQCPGTACLCFSRNTTDICDKACPCMTRRPYASGNKALSSYSQTGASIHIAAGSRCTRAPHCWELRTPLNGRLAGLSRCRDTLT